MDFQSLSYDKRTRIGSHSIMLASRGHGRKPGRRLAWTCCEPRFATGQRNGMWLVQTMYFSNTHNHATSLVVKVGYISNRRRRHFVSKVYASCFPDRGSVPRRVESVVLAPIRRRFWPYRRVRSAHTPKLLVDGWWRNCFGKFASRSSRSPSPDHPILSRHGSPFLRCGRSVVQSGIARLISVLSLIAAAVKDAFCVANELWRLAVFFNPPGQLARLLRPCELVDN